MMPNWHSVPFIRICLPFIAGIALAFHWQVDWLWVNLMYFIGIIPLVILFRKRIPYRWRWVYGTLASILFFIFGYQLTIQHNELNAPTHFSKLGLSELTLIGKVKAVNKKSFGHQYIIKVLHQIDSNGRKLATGNILAYLDSSLIHGQPGYGDVIAISGKAYTVNPPKNPHQFDYARYMHYQNIHFQVNANAASWQILEKQKGFNVIRLAQNLRAGFLEMIDQHISGERERAVASALLLGWKTDLDVTILNAYRNTGSAHVLAVSGLHVGLVFLLLNFFLGRFRKSELPSRLFRMIILLIGIWAYALVTGAPPSVQRAAAMLSFVIVGQTLNRQNNIYNSLAVSAFFLLCFEPYLLAQPGFQLSYFAVTGIVFFQPKIYRLIPFRNKIIDKIWALMAVSFAAQLVTIPLSLYYFHQFPFFFWLTGIIVIPLAAIIMPLGISLFVLGGLKPVAAGLGILLSAILKGMNYFILLIEKIPDAFIGGIWLAPFSVVLFYLAIFGLAILLLTQKLKIWYFILGCFLILSMRYSFAGIQAAQQKSIIVYNLYNSIVLDFINGNQAYTIIPHSGKEKIIKDYNRIVLPHQNAISINNLQYKLGLQDLKSNHFMIKGPFVQFFDNKIALIDDGYQPGSLHPFKLDGVIIMSHQIDLTAISKDFGESRFYIHSSIPVWEAKKMKKVLDLADVNYSDLRQDLALEINAVAKKHTGRR